MIDEMEVDEPRSDEVLGAAESGSSPDIREDECKEGLDDNPAANAAAANANEPGRFGIPWQTRIKESACCRDAEKYLKQSYKMFGGLQGQTGEAGLDGTGTTLKTHDMLKVLPTWNSLSDLGSGTGMLALHAALQCEGKVVGLEMSEMRVSTALNDLRTLTNAVCCIFVPYVSHQRDLY